MGENTAMVHAAAVCCIKHLTSALPQPPMVVLTSLLLSSCLGGNGASNSSAPTIPTSNVVTITVDGGPAAASGQINHGYVTVKICPVGSSGCASIDHVLLDTGSTGLRIVSSVLSAAGVNLTPKLDPQGQAMFECVTFNGGQTWGPVALADVTLAGELADKAAVQIMDDTSSSAPPPATCGANGSLINSVSGFGANGVLGVGVLIHDCGPACDSPASPLPFYYGCSSSGVCTAENAALTDQVSNVVSLFPVDNNGIMINLPNLVNANGDAVVQGQLIIGLATQTDNALPASALTVLGADATGQFTASYNGSAPLPSLIDSGTDSIFFNDSTIPTCTIAAFIGYYCPATAPLLATTVNNGLGAYMSSSSINFAISDPSSFVAGAAAFSGLAGGGGSSRFIWGMPFFYGRTVYFGFEQRTAANYTGPFYAY